MFDNEKMNVFITSLNFTLNTFGFLLKKNLSSKYHIDSIVTKNSNYVGLLAKPRHFIPRPMLLNIYKSLIHPYLTYGLAAWGQACKTYLKKIF